MVNDEIWGLIAKHLSGESTPEEEMALASWINSSEANQQLYKGIRQAWANKRPEQDPERLRRGKAMVFGRIEQDKHQPNIQELPSRGPRQPIWTIGQVAAVLLIVFFGWYGYTRIQLQNQPVNMVKVKNDGEPKSVQLPDGSTLWLNAESQVEYAENFSGKTREVFLEGEAFFEVQRNDSKPFIVHTGSLSTQVLGTSFNISAYLKPSEIRVTVSSGKVSVSDSTGMIGELVKDQQLSYQKSTGGFTRQSVQSQTANLWMEGKLVFESTTFGEVALMLDRQYHVNIQFSNNKLKNHLVSAQFDRTESLKQILYMLGMITDTEAVFQDEQRVMISSNHLKNKNLNK